MPSENESGGVREKETWGKTERDKTNKQILAKPLEKKANLIFLIEIEIYIFAK